MSNKMAIQDEGLDPIRCPNFIDYDDGASGLWHGVLLRGPLGGIEQGGIMLPARGIIELNYASTLLRLNRIG